MEIGPQYIVGGVVYLQRRSDCDARVGFEENTATLIVGEQDDLRVEIVVAPGHVLIRWKEGFGHKNDQWLRNLKTDVLWRLAE